MGQNFCCALLGHCWTLQTARTRKLIKAINTMIHFCKTTKTWLCRTSDSTTFFSFEHFDRVISMPGFVPFFRNNFPGLFQDFSRLRIDFSRTPKFTLTLSKFTLTLSKFYYFIQFNRFPGLSRTSSIFPGLSSPGKCDNKIPGLSRISRTRTNPVCSKKSEAMENSGQLLFAIILRFFIV